MVKKVVIKIQAGKISADYTGFVGRECERLEDKIRVPGLDVEDKEDKPEIYATVNVGESNANFQ